MAIFTLKSKSGPINIDIDQLTDAAYIEALHRGCEAMLRLKTRAALIEVAKVKPKVKRKKSASR
jgi:hypothetical protein